MTLDHRREDVAVADNIRRPTFLLRDCGALPKPRTLDCGDCRARLNELFRKPTDHLARIVIPSYATDDIRLELDEYGIDEAVIYPDLKGLGKGVSRHWLPDNDEQPPHSREDMLDSRNQAPISEWARSKEESRRFPCSLDRGRCYLDFGLFDMGDCCLPNRQWFRLSLIRLRWRRHERVKLCASELIDLPRRWGLHRA